MNELISIIIPVYKVEKYLRNCLDSVINQTYKNLEIILVDDGSPDACPQICDEYEKNDDRIKVIHKENGGLSSARNAGLDKCTGEYIAFIDSDDYVDKMYIEKLYRAAKDKNAQMAICSFFYVNEKGNLKKGTKLENKIVSGDEKMNYIYVNPSTCVDVSWGKLYHKNIWNNLRFPVGKIHEDVFVSDLTFNNANAVCFVAEYLYFYLQRNNSTSGKLKSNKTKNSLNLIEANILRFGRVDKNSKFFDWAVMQLLDSYVTVFRRVKHDKKLRNEVRENFKVKYNDFKKCKFTLKKHIKYLLFNYFPIIFIIMKTK